MGSGLTPSPYGKKHFVQDVTVCTCMSEEHQFTFTFDPEEEFEECWLDVHLVPRCRDHGFFRKFFCRQFWQRVLYGLRYIFGSHRSRHGAWDSVVVARDDARKIRDLMDRYFKFCESKDEPRASTDPEELTR